MILHTRLPYDPVARGLPGVAPLDPADWLLADEAYAGQMAERAALLATQREAVLWLDPVAEEAAADLLDTALAALPEGFSAEGRAMRCPDGRLVEIRRDDPLGTLGLLVQEDFCLMLKEGAAHVLRGAVLCFPASWRLSEKAGRPLGEIHAPVPAYDASLARRVQRLFDGVQPGRPLWRFNALWYDDPALFQPRSATAPRPVSDRGTAPYLRSERQCILRLRHSGAVVFSIHTYVLARDSLAARGT